jgi:hypothetical protein
MEIIRKAKVCAVSSIVSELRANGINIRCDRIHDRWYYQLGGEKQMTTYVTFGQDHTHHIAGKTFDKDCVAMLDSETAEEGRAKAFALFGSQFCFEYFNKLPNMRYFPRGLIEV